MKLGGKAGRTIAPTIRAAMSFYRPARARARGGKNPESPRRLCPYPYRRERNAEEEG